MNAVLKTFLSMSFSGSLLILALLSGKRLLKDKISRQWQYYIWLIVILRLLFPFGPKSNLLGNTYQAVDQAISQAASLPQPQLTPNAPGDASVPAADLEQNNERVKPAAKNLAAAHPLQDIGALLTNHVWLIWLVAALGLFIRKVTVYQSFIRYIHAGLTPTSDMVNLDRLSIIAEEMDIKRPVDLCVNPLISSPLLIGFFHPCIVLPSADIPEMNFRYIVLHELTHYKRRDMLYKWIVQITVCLHWFNPLVHLMSREITRACEFSCDEAVLAKVGRGSAQDYGKTLLDAMAAVGRYNGYPGSVSLSENKRLLKERLGAIMKFKTPSKAVKLLTVMLMLCVVLGASFVGVYSVSAVTDAPAMESLAGAVLAVEHGIRSYDNSVYNEGDFSQIEQYYESESLPLFISAFSRLDEDAQGRWLDRIYTDDRIAFWGAAVSLLDEDTLEEWLDKALADKNWPFQSVLFNALGRDDEFDGYKEKLEKEWAEAQAAEYQAAGVTMDGKDYYYQGQLVNIFLDARPDTSFYTLNMNPKGTLNIRIVRDENSEITGVANITEAEVTELFGDMEDPDDEADVEIIPVDIKTVASGDSIFLGEYTLSVGDRIMYDISAESGNGMTVFFAKNGEKNIFYWAAHIQRQPDESLHCTADFTVEPPAKPGTYKLYLQATEGGLGNVRGSVSIALADAFLLSQD